MPDIDDSVVCNVRFKEYSTTDNFLVRKKKNKTKKIKKNLFLLNGSNNPQQYDFDIDNTNNTFVSAYSEAPIASNVSFSDRAFFINMFPKPIGGLFGDDLCSIFYYDPDTSEAERDSRYEICAPGTG